MNVSLSCLVTYIKKNAKKNSEKTEVQKKNSLFFKKNQTIMVLREGSILTGRLTDFRKH